MIYDKPYDVRHDGERHERRRADVELRREEEDAHGEGQTPHTDEQRRREQTRGGADAVREPRRRRRVIATDVTPGNDAAGQADERSHATKPTVSRASATPVISAAAISVARNNNAPSDGSTMADNTGWR
jgi:hypothetical protein